MLASCGSTLSADGPRHRLDEALLRPCDTGTDLTSVTAGVPTVALTDEKDALLTVCAQRHGSLAASVRVLLAP